MTDTTIDHEDSCPLCGIALGSLIGGGMWLGAWATMWGIWG